jgi:hypothetical protein
MTRFGLAGKRGFVMHKPGEGQVPVPIPRTPQGDVKSGTTSWSFQAAT